MIEMVESRWNDAKSDSKVRYTITSLKRGDMGIRGKIHPEDTL